MKISFIDIEEEKEFTTKKVHIMLSHDVAIRISINNFGELVINKMAIEGDGTIIVKPSVSNEIRIS